MADYSDSIIKALSLLAVYITDFGPCDHSVGVCQCGDIRTYQDARAWAVANIPDAAAGLPDFNSGEDPLLNVPPSDVL